MLPKTSWDIRFSGTVIVSFIIRECDLRSPIHIVPRTKEGYYHCTGGIEVSEVPSALLAFFISSQPAIKRAMAFAPYADILWLETKNPDIEQARSFARKIREKFPGKYVHLDYALGQGLTVEQDVRL